MSGGKYTTESATFVPIITAALLGALIKCGTEAVSEAGKSIEYQKLLDADRVSYNESLQKQQEQNRRSLDIYTNNLRIEIVRLEKELENKGIRVGGSSKSYEERLQQLYSALNANTSIQQNTRVKTYFASLSNLESTKTYFTKICEIADQIIIGSTKYKPEAISLKKRAENLIATNNRDIKAFQEIHDQLCQILPSAKITQEKEKSLKNEYMTELAKAKSLCHITNTLTLYPSFSYDTAEQAIIKLKEISRHQIELIEKIKSNPTLHMTPEKREKACEVVANKICAALVANGIQLKQVNVINSSRICYYYYESALLKVVVTNTGAVTFEVVGNSEKKTGFTNYDKKRVLEAMEQFQAYYPELQNQLSKNNVVLTLHECIEPNESIVTYEKPEFLTAEQRAANESAVLAMLQASEKVRYVDGT